MIGKTLGHYEISSLLGKGGMGEVYQAKDLKLGRDVAIKLLPKEFAQDTDRVARFQREAKLLASLSHPNIAAIHGLEEFGGTSFLVLELVEGETLADQIKRGPIPVEESLKLALQIAEALEAAHEKGVIHRDLKPSNIKVTPDGKVKVLDFGLAKEFAGDREEVNLSNSPTLSDAATQQGVILGTAAYMSPEQAKGKAVDKRADIWAFGVVLFEMLTGRQVFTGETVSDTLASVLAREPRWQRLPPNLHPRIRLLLERCLKKEPRDRYNGISDGRVDIQDVLSYPSGVFVPPTAAQEPRTRLRTMLPWVAAALVLGLIIAGVAVWKLKPTEPRPISRFSYELQKDQQFDDLYEKSLAVSPDGRKFVYSTKAGLYLRSMDDMEAKLLPGTGGSRQQPFFSPDGKWIGFFSSTDSRLKKVAASGGAPITLAQVSSLGSFDWSTDDTIVYGQLGRGIMRIFSNGGTPEQIVRANNEAIGHPMILPDGKSILFTRIWPRPLKIMVQSLKSGERKELVEGHTARYVATGHIIFCGLGNNLFAVRFDPNDLKMTGEPVPLAENVLTAGGAPQYAVSESGTLIFVPGTAASSSSILVFVDRDGKEQPIDAPPRAYAHANLSPDGTRIALDIRDQENDIWIWDLARKTLSRLTFDSGMNRGGIWSPDGKKVAFSAERDGSENIYWQAADGLGAAEPLTKLPNASIEPATFSPDGNQLLFAETVSPYRTSFINLRAGAEPKRLLPFAGGEQFNLRISPNGRWLAYASNESARTEVYVRPFPNVESGRWQISTEGGSRPLWNQNGRELYYYLPPGIVMAVPVETGTSFKAGSPKVVFKGEYLSLQSLTRDGQRFLMIKDAAAKPDINPAWQRINIVLNWTEELKQRVPGK